MTEAEFLPLFDRYRSMVYGLALSYPRSPQDAEDICQTVFLKLLTSGQAFDSPAHEKAWIIRTTANACKDLLRSAHRRRTVALEAASATPAPGAPDSAVLEAVMALPENYREAVYLHYFEGYSVREIAGLLGRSEAAVTAHLSRGRHKLRTTLGGECYEQSV